MSINQPTAIDLSQGISYANMSPLKTRQPNDTLGYEEDKEDSRKEHLRKPLWESPHSCCNYISGPWCLSGDFNVIMDAEEKKVEILEACKSWDFIDSMEECGMMDAGFSGPRFTWCNARDKRHRIWKRLDRALINQEWIAKYSRISVEHLASTGSDHTLMLILSKEVGRMIYKATSCVKLKLLSKNLSKWSREQIGDIQKHVKEWENKMQQLEDQYIDDNRDEAREEMHKAQATYTKWLKCEDSLLRQKANIKWLDEETPNTLRSHKEDGSHHIHPIHHIDCITQEVAEDHNEALTTIPTKEEIKKVVFDLNSNSAPGPDGFNGEIIHGIRNKKEGENVILKLDMSKAYDRVNWQFLMTVLRKFGFSDKWVDLVWRSISNICPKTSSEEIARIKNVTGYKHKEFPFIYLGCPIYIGRKLIATFNDSVTKVVRKISGWQGKLLSVGGKAILIKHVLQYQPIYLLAVLKPPNEIFLQIERYMTRFFWGSTDEKMKRHWSSWAKMCYPIEEGGLGFKRLKDISEALAMKRWWRFRTENTLWAEFLKIKYSRLAHPIDRKWRAGLSHSWQSILEVKDKVEEQMLWKINSGSSNLWWDNWTGLGALAHVILHNDIGRNHRVNEILEDGLWNIEQLHLPEYLAELILAIPIGNMNLLDNPIWMPSPMENSQLPLHGNHRQNETIHHIFLDGELARTIWNFFGIPLGIPWEHNTLRTLLMKWWSVKAENGLHKDLLKVIPVVIFWEIWKSRCSNRYGKSKISKVRVIYQVSYHIRWLVR
ncbi:uncharacterized protein LOC132054125 [Lycium ferocissimum]|uniref:uncharacterized protein LOC132054125 n=1 Tax=Lycium ferocissimum TaxID=112874 RepID=UPI0028149B0D|nr:uncharacterized protein LOC132054125 [Lycium ferocissimum]